MEAKSYHGGGTQACCYPASDMDDRRYILLAHSGRMNMFCQLRPIRCASGESCPCRDVGVETLRPWCDA
jgi:hypothetical protein